MKLKPHEMTPRHKRHNRVRARVHGTVERPRLNVFRSLNHIYAQVINDIEGRTLVAASTRATVFTGSPMAVKSAMMTTAYDLKKADGTPDQNPFNQGAGHVDPTKFFDPGLVVTSGRDEWLSFFEGQGFDLGPTVSPMAASDLNIPSMAKGQVTSSVTIARTFTALKAGTWDVAAEVPGFDVGLGFVDQLERPPLCFCIFFRFPGKFGEFGQRLRALLL